MTTTTDKAATPVLLAYRRDASWHNSIGIAYAHHMASESDAGLAACSRRTVLMTDSGVPATEVSEYQRCRRAACRNRWPSTRENTDSPVTP